jgi:SAM-dependent methyltransferase
MASPTAVKGVDQTVGFVNYARREVTDSRASFELGDAQALPEDANAYDAVVAGLVLNFVPRPAVAMSEMMRVAKPEGVVAVYVWDYGGEMQFMRRFWDAAVALDPAAVPLDEGIRFSISRPEQVEPLFRDAGLQDIEVRAIDVPTVFRDFDDYWTPFLGGIGPAPAYALSLSEEPRTALRERIRAGLPVEADGSIHLIARAWAAKGKKP